MYNESKRIRENIERLTTTLHSTDHEWELILVDDGSDDDTRKIADDAAAREPRVRILGYPENRGRGYALRHGFQAARGHLVVVTESDLSYGTDIIERLLSELSRTQADVVVASPHHPEGTLENIPSIRLFYTKVGNWVLRFFMPVRLTTYTGMTRGYRGEVLQTIDLISDDKEIHLEIVAKLSSLGCRFSEIPATIRWAPGRKQRKSTFKARQYVISHLLFGAFEAPLRVLSLLGVLSILAGLGGMTYLFLLSWSGTSVAGRPLMLYSLLGILSGLLVLVFGFLAQQNKHLERQLHRLQRDVLSINRGDSETERRRD